MRHSERNLSVIENFILYVTHCNEGDKGANKTIDLTADELYTMAREYIKEDCVDGESY